MCVCVCVGVGVGVGVGVRRRVLWVFFDLESTGLDVRSDAIVQVTYLSR